jgi:hypothetical protein
MCVGYWLLKRDAWMYICMCVCGVMVGVGCHVLCLVNCVYSCARARIRYSYVSAYFLFFLQELWNKQCRQSMGVEAGGEAGVR